MAHIIQQTFLITISKLVKNDHTQDVVCTPDQTHMLLDTLPGVVEQILEHAPVVVEVITGQEDPD
jgi:hypothetical protein